jgi:hypothetical protein
MQKQALSARFPRGERLFFLQRNITEQGGDVTERQAALLTITKRDF